MKNFSLLFRLDWFDLTWQHFAAFGYADEIGGKEYRRVVREWTRLGYPIDTGLVMHLAKISPDGKTVPQDKPGSTNGKPRG